VDLGGLGLRGTMHLRQIGSEQIMLRCLRLTFTFFALAYAAAVLVMTGVSSAGDLKAGRQKALQCQTCHGLDGEAKLPEAPTLAGQSEVYLIKSMQDYRTGARKNDMMSIVASALKDQDIADLAAYYAAIPFTVGPPPK
jgi:cytochrome c553